MTAVKISGTFKKDERPYNGLEAIADDLLNEAQQRRTYLVVAEVRSHGYQYNAEDGTKTPTVKFDHIEAALDEGERKLVKDLLTKIYERRTGAEMPATLFDDLDDDGAAANTDDIPPVEDTKGKKK